MGWACQLTRGGGFACAAVLLGVRLGGFRRVMHGVVVMAVSGVGVMRGEMMVSGFMVLGGFAVVASCVFVMFGGFVVMLGCLLGHVGLLRFEIWAGRKAGERRLNPGCYEEMNEMQRTPYKVQCIKWKVRG